MTYPLLRFAMAIMAAGVISLILILLMKVMISDYDKMAEDAVVRLINVKMVVFPRAEVAGTNADNTEQEQTSVETEAQITTDTRSDELKEILRKKEEIISTLEKSE